MKKGLNQAENIIKTKIICDQIPKNIDFGSCPVQKVTSKTFLLKNFENKTFNFSFSKCPFEFQPSEGLIAPDQIVQIQVSCTESNAKILIAKTLFKAAGKKSVIKLSAIFKYPHIVIKNPRIDFKETLIGTQKKLSLEMHNPTDIPVNFEIVRSPTDEFEDFSVICETPKGQIQPNGFFYAAFKYTPFVAELRTMATFEVFWMEDMKSEIEITGFSQRLHGKLSSNILNFGFVKSESKKKLECTLYNCVAREVEFELKVSNAAFKFHKSHGRLPGLSYVRLICQFNPVEEGIYYEKGYVFIKDQDLISFELIGVCYKSLFFVDNFIKLIQEDDVGIGGFASVKNQLVNSPLKDAREPKGSMVQFPPIKNTFHQTETQKPLNNTFKITSKQQFKFISPLPLPYKTLGSLKNLTINKQGLEEQMDSAKLIDQTSNEGFFKKDSSMNLEKLIYKRPAEDCNVQSFLNFGDLFTNSSHVEGLFSISLKNNEFLNFDFCFEKPVTKNLTFKNISLKTNLTFLLFTKNKQFQFENCHFTLKPLEQKALSIVLESKSINQIYFGQVCISIFTEITENPIAKNYQKIKKEINSELKTQRDVLISIPKVLNSSNNKKIIRDQSDLSNGLKCPQKTQDCGLSLRKIERLKNKIEEINLESNESKIKNKLRNLMINGEIKAKECESDLVDQKKIDCLVVNKEKSANNLLIDKLQGKYEDSNARLKSKEHLLIKNLKKLNPKSKQQLSNDVGPKISELDNKSQRKTNNNRADQFMNARMLLEPITAKNEHDLNNKRKTNSHFKEKVPQTTFISENFRNDVVKITAPSTNFQNQEFSKEESFVLLSSKIHLFGHSFLDTSKCMQPILNFNPEHMVYFQPTFPGDASYQSLKIENKGDTNCFLRLQKQPKTFSCFPSFLLLSPKKSKSIFLRFFTKKVGFFEETLTFVANFNSHYNLKLRAHCLVSSLEIENNGELYLPPNNYGVKTHSSLLFRNTGRNPIAVNIKVPPEDLPFLQVQPSEFSISEKKTESVTFSFTPLANKAYTIPCAVEANYRKELICKKQVCVYGRGDDGRIIIRPSDIDFGIVMVNHKTVKKVNIQNLSECNFYVHLKLEIERIDQVDQSNQLSDAFSLDFTEGLIGCRITKTVSITFVPKEISSFKLKLNLFVSPNVETYIGPDLDSADFSKAKLEFKKNFQKVLNPNESIRVDNSDDDDHPTSNGDQKPFNQTTSLQGLKQLEKNQHEQNDPQTLVQKKEKNVKKSLIFRQEENSMASNNSNLKLSQAPGRIKAVLKDFCRISAKAKYPHLKITNVQSNEMSVVYIWDKFQITEINREFSKNLSQFELKYAKRLTHLFDETLDLDCKNRCFSFDFGYVYNKSDQGPRIVKISIQNSGGTELKWKFQEKEDKDQFDFADDDDFDEETSNPNTILFENEKVSRKLSNFLFRPRLIH